MKRIIAIVSGCALTSAALMTPGAEPAVSAAASSCYKSDVAWSTLIDAGDVAAQFADIRNGVQGVDWISSETVDDSSPGNRSFTTTNLRFHTPGNTSIAFSKECDWTRWFQTEGFIQGFRLRSGENNRAANWENNISARVEAFATLNGWTGTAENSQKYWWEGQFQIKEDQDGALFQLKQASPVDWVMHLRMDPNGNVFLLKRTWDGANKKHTIQRIPSINVGTSPFRVRVEYYNKNWRVQVVQGTRSTSTSGTAFDWGTNSSSQNQFRWGSYNDGYDSSTSTFGNKGSAANSRVLVAGARYGVCRPTSVSGPGTACPSSAFYNNTF